MKLALLLSSILLLSIGKVNAEPGWDPFGIKERAGKLLKTGNYDGLEALSSELKKKGYDICQDYPELTGYYDAFEMDGKQDEKQWQDRRKELDAWASAFPDSLSAKLASANWYIGYAWKARGTGYAGTVAAEGWMGMTERLKKAEEILGALPAQKVDDPQYYYLWITVCLGEQRSVPETFQYFKKGIDLQKEYYPLYQNAAYYLLPRWYGEPGDRERFMTESADSFPPAKGDVLYAYLTRADAHFFGNDFYTQVRIDYDRAKRGYLSRIATNNPAKRQSESALCYLAAVKGDDEIAKKLFLELDDLINAGDFGGQQNLDAFRKKCGAQTAVDDALALERAGKLDEAETNLASFTSDPAAYYPLVCFYMRQGMEAKVRAMKFKSYGKTCAEMCDMDAASATPDQLAEMAQYLPMLGKWDKAEAAARRFDQLRPWNLIGKNTLLLCAIQKADARLADEMKKEIIGMKTDRASYQAAQALLNGAKTWGEVGSSIETSGDYLPQGATSIALYYIAEGKGDSAKQVLEDALPFCIQNDHKTLMQCLLFGSLSQTLKPVSILK